MTKLSSAETAARKLARDAGWILKRNGLWISSTGSIFDGSAIELVEHDRLAFVASDGKVVAYA